LTQDKLLFILKLEWLKIYTPRNEIPSYAPGLNVEYFVHATNDAPATPSNQHVYQPSERRDETYVGGVPH